MAQIPSTPSQPRINKQIDDARPKPTKTTGSSGPVKTPPPAPKKVEDKGPLPEARKAAVEGANEVKKAMDAQPTPERAIIAGGIKAGEEAIKVVKKGAEEIGEKVAEATKPIHEPFTREIKEAGKEIGKAGSDYGKSWFDSLNPFDEKNVRDAWENAPTPERGVVFAGIEAAKNVFNDGVENVKNLGNLGKEVAEGIGEVWLHNPVNNAIVEGAKGVAELGKKGWEATSDWVGDRISGGAEGAVEAGKTLADTGSSNAERTADQLAENAKEIGDAARNFGDNFDGYSEISETWENQPTIERQIVAAGYEAVENTIQGVGATLFDTGNIIKEVHEAGIENVITGAQNFGNSVAGGLEAAGDFVGGLFGG